MSQKDYMPRDWLRRQPRKPRKRKVETVEYVRHLNPSMVELTPEFLRAFLEQIEAEKGRASDVERG